MFSKKVDKAFASENSKEFKTRTFYYHLTQQGEKRGSGVNSHNPKGSLLKGTFKVIFPMIPIPTLVFVFFFFNIYNNKILF